MILGGYEPFSLSDYPQKPAAVVFTKGCNLRCPYCHNSQLWTESSDASELSEREVLDQLEKRRGLLDAVVISGGEPTIQKDLCDFIQLVKNMGFAIKLDTNGTNPEMLEELIARGLVDFIAMDIKAPLRKYEDLTGVEINTSLILNSMHIISASDVDHLFRTTWVDQMLSDECAGKIKAMIPPGSTHKWQKFVPQNAADPQLQK